MPLIEAQVQWMQREVAYWQQINQARPLACGIYPITGYDRRAPAQVYGLGYGLLVARSADAPHAHTPGRSVDRFRTTQVFDGSDSIVLDSTGMEKVLRALYAPHRLGVEEPQRDHLIRWLNNRLCQDIGTRTELPWDGRGLDPFWLGSLKAGELQGYLDVMRSEPGAREANGGKRLSSSAEYLGRVHSAALTRLLHEALRQRQQLPEVAAWNAWLNATDGPPAVVHARSLLADFLTMPAADLRLKAYNLRQAVLRENLAPNRNFIPYTDIPALREIVSAAQPVADAEPTVMPPWRAPASKPLQEQEPAPEIAEDEDTFLL